MNDTREESIQYLKSLNNRDLYWVMKDIFEGYSFTYDEATEAGMFWPSSTAKLAVIKHILLN